MNPLLKKYEKASKKNLNRILQQEARYPFRKIKFYHELEGVDLKVMGVDEETIPDRHTGCGCALCEKWGWKYPKRIIIK